MSEKRFTLNLMKKPSEIEMDGKMISKYDVVRLLNTLHQENLSLKFELDECANNKLYSRRKLEEENEKLKEQNRKLYKLALNCKTIGDSDE